ncbi:MAG: cation transporter [Clostridia bacterium]|nr:cation transporter [Clostridia bacterium]
MTESVKKRERLGKMASLLGIAVNILLALGKIIVGSLFGAVSLVADGTNNLSDSFSNIISFISFKLSAKPADEEHPFGHERIEYILSMFVAFLILTVALDLVKESFAKIITPDTAAFSWLMVVVLAVSILAKLALFIVNRKIGKAIDSDILKATALDSVADSVSTAVVLIALFVSRFTGFNLDGYAGVLVSLFIGWTGINVLRETFSKLIGQAPSAEMIADIKKRVLAHPEVLGIHDLTVYSYGPNKYFASVHLELDAAVDVMISHELVDAIEREFITETNIVLTGHLDPVVTDDPELNTLREQIEALVTELDGSFTMHDFRMVKGPTRTNVIFDIAVPYACCLNKGEIVEWLQKRVAEISEHYFLVVTVEYQTL